LTNDEQNDDKFDLGRGNGEKMEMKLELEK
jgi:hypothetical protein